MTIARKDLVKPHLTRYYHLYNRCVRQAFLMGKDRLSGKNYSHRKTWIVKRLSKLSRLFAIRVASYAILSDHYHLVVYIDKDESDSWTKEEVVCRWSKLCRVNDAIKNYAKNNDNQEIRIDSYEKLICKWRQHLSDISWFMKLFNEYIARRANKEERKVGKFFESRFKCQALLDQQALLLCMLYVDLNPVRAGLASTPENSMWTSIKQRILEFTRGRQVKENIQIIDAYFPVLIPFLEEERARSILPFTFTSYLQIIDWMGRVKKYGKKGVIPQELPSILKRLKVDPKYYFKHMKLDGDRFTCAVGTPQSLKRFAHACKKNWVQGFRFSEKLFGAT